MAVELGSDDATPKVVYAYDQGSNGKGHRTAMRDESGATISSYDQRGRLTGTTRTITNTLTGVVGTYSFGYGYDSSDQRISVTYPTGETVTTGTNSQNLPKTVTSGASTYLSNLTYNHLSLPVQLSYGSGVNTSFTYYGIEMADTSPSMYGRLWQIRTFQGSTEYGRLEYDYHRNGNIRRYIDWGNPGVGSAYKRGHEYFSYDHLDRLIGAVPDDAVTANSYSATYQYDAIGRITFKREWRDGVFDTQITLAYNTSVPLHAPASVTINNGTPVGYSYSANGNLIARGSSRYVYDAENRLVRVRDQSGASILRVLYDGDGQRILTIDASGTRVTLDKLYEKHLGTNDQTIFVSAGSRLIATKKVPQSGSSTVSTIHPDHLGGVALTMQGTTVVADLAYFPYGEQRSTSYVAPSGLPSDKTFNGESFIGSVGFYQMGARWLDPVIGLWLSADSIIPDTQNPQALNRFAYVFNSPLASTDSTGHCPEKWCQDQGGRGPGSDPVSAAYERANQAYWRLRDAGASHEDALAHAGYPDRGPLSNNTPGARGTVPIGRGVGRWVQNRPSMSDEARAFQQHVTGVESGWEFEVNTGSSVVRFDGLRLTEAGEPVLLDAKYAGSGSKSLYSKVGDLPFARNQVLSEAYRQVNAAQGLQIEWHVSDRVAWQSLEKLFVAARVGIRVVYTPWTP